MNELFAEAAIDIINDMHTERLDYETEYLPLINAAMALQEYESGEYEKVVHAHWEFDEFGCYCTNCHEYADEDNDGVCKQSSYCPECGAKMDEEEY